MTDKKFGDIFYSPYFASRGVVVRYVNEKEWYFVLENRPTGLRAQAKPDDVQWLREGE